MEARELTVAIVAKSAFDEQNGSYVGSSLHPRRRLARTISCGCHAQRSVTVRYACDATLTTNGLLYGNAWQPWCRDSSRGMTGTQFLEQRLATADYDCKRK
jgi:hypothetical protein